MGFWSTSVRANARGCEKDAGMCMPNPTILFMPLALGPSVHVNNDKLIAEEIVSELWTFSNLKNIGIQG